jgi:hypothetical protein
VAPVRSQMRPKRRPRAVVAAVAAAAAVGSLLRPKRTKYKGPTNTKHPRFNHRHSGRPTNFGAKVGIGLDSTPSTNLYMVVDLKGFILFNRPLVVRTPSQPDM